MRLLAPMMLTGLADGQKIHELLGLDIVVLDESLNGIFILLGTYVFVSREICKDVEAFLLSEDALEDRISEVEGVTAKLLRYVETFGRAHVTNEFCESVFVEINNNDRCRFETKNCLNEAGTDRAGTTYYTHLLTLDFRGKLLGICLNVRLEH